MADVFLSYARPDAAAAARMARELGKSGRTVWYDSELPAHRAYADVIERELEAAAAVVVLWSRAAVDSQWVRSEANRARELGKLVQARLDGTRLPMPFDQIQCADLSNWKRGRSQVDASIGALLGGDAAWPREPAGRGSSRRQALMGGAAAAVVAGGTGWWLLGGKASQPKLSPQTSALLEQGKAAWWQNTPEGQNQAIGIFKQVVADNPNFAEGWGRLSMAYAIASHWRDAQEATLLQERSRSAAQRSLSLDDDPYGLIGSAICRPYLGNWGVIEPILRRAVKVRPKDGEVNFMLAFLLTLVGRSREAIQHANTNLPSGPAPGIYVWRAQMLWCAGRSDELDQLLDEATKLYPTHFGVWFTRFYTWMMGGRPEAALAFAADTANRPIGIDPKEVESVVRVAKAIQSPSVPAVKAVVEEWTERAHHGAGYAENAAQFMSSLGEPDAAFPVLRAYYFSEGFDCGEVRFESAIGSFTARNDRQTAFLFNPAMKEVRSDPRFSKLISDLRFSEYWRASGRKPDYLT